MENQIIERTGETIVTQVVPSIKLEGWPAAVTILGLGALYLTKAVLTKTDREEVSNPE